MANSAIIKDIQFLMRHFNSINIAHIYREANREADWIANVGHLVTDSFIIDLCNAPELCKILVTDALGIPLERRVS